MLQVQETLLGAKIFRRCSPGLTVAWIIWQAMYASPIIHLVHLPDFLANSSRSSYVPLTLSCPHDKGVDINSS